MRIVVLSVLVPEDVERLPVTRRDPRQHSDLVLYICQNPFRIIPTGHERPLTRADLPRRLQRVPGPQRQRGRRQPLRRQLDHMLRHASIYELWK